MLLNADDPLVTSLGKGVTDVKYFGFEDVEYFSKEHSESSNAPTEVFNCVCNNPLEYSKHFFAQEGHYFCNNCGYKRPEIDYKGYGKIYKDYTELIIEEKSSGKTYEFKFNLVGLYNAYNVLGAVSQALIYGIDYETIKCALNSYKSIFGRAERKIINSHPTLIQLIKNPTGASEVLKTVDLNSNIHLQIGKDESFIIVAINDNYADGRDISWLWDSDFEQLKDAKNLVITSGTRAKDMALRLKYAGIPSNKILVIEDLKKAIDMATSNEVENVTILPSYTALLKISKMKFKK